MKIGDIVLVRIYGGEMIIGRVSRDLQDDRLVLDDPRLFIMAPSMDRSLHVVLAGVSEPLKVERLKKSLSIRTNQILYHIEESELDKEIVNGYLSEVSGIKLATTADMAALGAC